MVTSRIATSKKPTAKTASSAPAKKPLAKKAVAGTPATKPKTTTNKVAVTPVKKAAAVPAKKVSAPKAAKAATTAKSTPKKIAKKITVSPEERYQMIATAAYFLAERRGFDGCYEMGDWITAEAEIDAKLNA